MATRHLFLWVAYELFAPSSSSYSSSSSFSYQSSSVSFLAMPSMSMLLSSSVCQGLHPLKLKKPQIHRWVLLSCTRGLGHATSKKTKEEMNSGGGGGGGGEGGGWSSIYSFSSPSKSPVKDVDKSWSIIKSPPPPSTKRANHGKKNLAMCTETLGCETGAVYPVGDFDADTDENGHTGRPEEEKVAMRRKRGSKKAGFPPPLTTLSGESRRRIMSKRENGRLLLLLVKPSVMEAERTEGRLRLRLYSGKRFHCNDKKVEQLENEEVEEEEEGEKEEKEEEEGGYLGVVGMEMNEMSYGSINGGEEMKIGRFRMPGGCQEEEGGGHAWGEGESQQGNAQLGGIDLRGRQLLKASRGFKERMSFTSQCFQTIAAHSILHI